MTGMEEILEMMVPGKSSEESQPLRVASRAGGALACA